MHYMKYINTYLSKDKKRKKKKGRNRERERERKISTKKWINEE